MRRARRKSRRAAWSLVAAAPLVLSGFVLAGWALLHWFEIHRLSRQLGDTVFLSAEGRPLFPLDEERRDVPLAEISPHLKKAVIAVEDHRFYWHPGIDPIGTARALLHTVTGRRLEGGSTITQQLARTLFLTNRRTMARKVKEAVLALMLEHQLTKDQILELYLNRVYVGAGTRGVEAIARRLYGKRARDLDLAEAAMLAGLIRAPSALSPYRNPEAAGDRAGIVLRRMREEGFITRREDEAALRTKVRVVLHEPARRYGGYLKDFLRDEFRRHFGDEDPPGWRVYTSVVPAVQQAAESAVRDGLAAMGRPELQAALAALDPQTGAVLALVGGRDFASSPFNRATDSRRQPGSAFKPVVYAAALEHGLTPVSRLSGLASLPPQGPEEWAPRNAEGALADELTLRAAIVESNNRAAAALQRRIGARPILSLAGRLGLRDLPDVPSLALGSGVVTPLALAAAYTAFPGGGLAARPVGILRVEDGDGDDEFRAESARERVLSPESAFQMVSLLADVLDRGTGSRARELGVRFPSGGKTGTTNEFKDAWFVGFSSAVVAGVWVGFDQPATIGDDAYGGRVALPIWADFMLRTARLLPPKPFTMPDGLREDELCQVTYLRAAPACPSYVEYFKKGDPGPRDVCPVHRGERAARQKRERREPGGLLGRLKRILGL